MAGRGGDMPAVGTVSVDKEERISAIALAELGEQKGPFLSEMIAEVRKGNKEKLQKSLFTLKAGLSSKEAELSLADVIEIEDLIPVLIRGLTINKVPIQMDASWIICEILVKGTPAQREKVMVGEGAAIYPALLKMLASPKEKIWQHSLNTLVWMFDKERTRPQLQDPAIIPAITKLAEKTDDLAQLRNVGRVACFYLKRDHVNSHPLSLETVRNSVALFRILYRKTTEDDITTGLTLCLVFFWNVEGSAKVIVSGRILPFVVGHLCHSNHLVRAAVIFIISKVAGRGPEMLEFFLALKGTEGMKHIYKNVRNSEVMVPELDVEANAMKAELLQFWLSLKDTLIEGDVGLKTRLANAFLECGFIFSLLKCLEEKETPEPFTLLAVLILSKIMGELGSERVRLVMEAGIVPLLVNLLNSSRKLVRWLAVQCLGHGDLIKTGPCVRNELVQLGGIDKLMELLEEEGLQEVMMADCALFCFEDLVATKPRVALDKYEKLPEVLKKLLEAEVLSRFKMEVEDDNFVANVLVRVFRCVGHLAAYGKNGRELVEKSGFLEGMIEMLQYDHPEAQRVALETLAGICKADKKYLAVLIQKGIFEHFELLCNSHGMEFVDKYKIFINYLAEELSPGQVFMLKHVMDKDPSALAEMFRALKGSENPVTVFKTKINEVLSRGNSMYPE